MADETPLVGVHEAAKTLGVSPFRVSELVRKGDFPPPLQRLAQGDIWLASTIEEYAWTREPPPPPDLAEFQQRMKHMYGCQQNPLRLRAPGARVRNA